MWGLWVVTWRSFGLKSCQQSCQPAFFVGNFKGLISVALFVSLQLESSTNITNIKHDKHNNLLIWVCFSLYIFLYAEHLENNTNKKRHHLPPFTDQCVFGRHCSSCPSRRQWGDWMIQISDLDDVFFIFWFFGFPQIYEKISICSSVLWKLFKCFVVVFPCFSLGRWLKKVIPWQFGIFFHIKNLPLELGWYHVVPRSFPNIKRYQNRNQQIAIVKLQETWHWGLWYFWMFVQLSWAQNQRIDKNRFWAMEVVEWRINLGFSDSWFAYLQSILEDPKKVKIVEGPYLDGIS